MSKFAVIYASETGNTRRLAEEIHGAIRSEEKTLIDVRSFDGTLDADVLFVGFWVNHLTCSLEIIDLLSSLHGKHVALFATCGLGDTHDYYKRIEHNVHAFLPEDNNYLGAYFCRGKMPSEIRRRYEEARGTFRGTEKDAVYDDVLARMIASFDDALTHPDKQDLAKAGVFVNNIFKMLGIR